MDGQESGDGAQRSTPMSAEEIKAQQRFLGSYTAADRPGVPVHGEKPDNVRRLDAKRERTQKEVD